MVPLRLDRARIERFLVAAGDRLTGDWLLIGGAAAAVWFSHGRVTEDVDLIGLAGTAAQRLQLMELAMAEGLPIEAVNSAADFFVHRIPDWRSALEVLRHGASATIYRPTPTLFLLLKCRRLSEADLEDCRALIRFARAQALTVEVARVAAELDGLAATTDAALAERRRMLREALDG